MAKERTDSSVKDQLQYHGTITSYGTDIKQYKYKNLSVCVSYDDEAMDERDATPGTNNVLHISFDSGNNGIKSKADMLYCAKRLGLDTTKPFKEYDIPSSNPLTTPRYIHYYEQIV